MRMAMTGRRRELVRLLTDYRPTDDQEIAFRVRMLDVAVSAHDPFDRHSFEPGHFTASGFVLHPDGDRVLLIRHRKLGIWLQPGGHIDAEDASPLEAARREIGEEAGLVDLHPVGDGLVDIDIHRFPEREGDLAHDHLDLRFAFVSPTDRLSPNDEAVDARWVGKLDLEGLAVDRSITRPVGKVLD